MTGQGDDRQLAMAPSRLAEFIALVRDRFEEAARQGEAPSLWSYTIDRPGGRFWSKAIAFALAIALLAIALWRWRRRIVLARHRRLGLPS